MAGDDLRLDAEFVEIGAEAEAHRLHAQKIQLFAEQPAGIVFAEAIGRDQGFVFIFQGVGLEVGAGFVGHGHSNALGNGPSITREFRDFAAMTQISSCFPDFASYVSIM